MVWQSGIKRRILGILKEIESTQGIGEWPSLEVQISICPLGY